ncbi:DUF2996 domain-containing protein [Gloeobacter kilaueensis]|uniref:Alpha-ketoglutarate decarboxylase n=1 Tax=Gloeobacter kilaueensis (strain ATCC BAA-2537 / CCAP 1431/1 / ULC 316 / JS1) TaxID=1183438 RepID=U5QRC2_GLOK1|nr:DUF2996 domain-containing protein [Gloeobacter kilaueensis]AGY60265.1 alpha-ketoglutarate decarboxylase [Gloeobacter kilaueensis JS1]
MPEDNQAPPPPAQNAAEPPAPPPVSEEPMRVDTPPEAEGVASEAAPKPPRPKPAAAAEGGEAPPARPARPKPGEVPDKPLADYIQQDILPLLEKRMKAEGAGDIALSAGESDFTASWEGGNKTFTVYFDEGNLEGRKSIAYNQVKSPGRVVQMFMPPERGFKGVDARQIVVMILQQFTSTLTWIKKTPAQPAAAGAGAKKPKK